MMLLHGEKLKGMTRLFFAYWQSAPHNLLLMVCTAVLYYKMVSGHFNIGNNWLTIVQHCTSLLDEIRADGCRTAFSSSRDIAKTRRYTHNSDHDFISPFLIL